MLATVLRTEVASKMSVAIMRAFVVMRKYISSNLIQQKYINNQVLKNTEEIKILQESFQKFEEKKKVNEIYFNGQIFDAYSKIQEIFKSATKKLIIIDAKQNHSDYFFLINIKLKELNLSIISEELIKYFNYLYNKVIYGC